MKFNSIKTEIIKLEQLFSNKKSYVVPAYQRPYEWSDKQIESLLNDITEFYNSNKGTENVYLVSTMQLTINENGELEVIDGHQRITTFYLLKKALHSTIEFKYRNEIYGFNKSLNDLVSDKNTLYYKNFDYIKRYINNFLNDVKTDEKSFVKYLDEHIVFASITLANNSPIKDTLQVFNSLNTTGLNLDVKDIFKIKFSKYLNQENGFDCFNRINKAYSAVISPINNLKEPTSSVYCLEEDDLLDTYRFYLISQTEKNSYASDMRESNAAFFERYFENNENKIKPELNLNTFCDIAECINKVQNFIYKRDQETSESMNIICCCARNFIIESGYSKLKNIYYYLIYIQYKNNKKIDKAVETADKITDLLWKYCSIYRFLYSKIINHVFFKVGEALFTNRNIDNLLENVSCILKDDIRNNSWSNFDDFNKLLTHEGNVIDCNKPHLLIILSYINDANKTNVFQIKKDIFYRTYFNSGKRKKWDLDIEHILSRSLYENKTDVNSIGNLMYLSSSINKTLGAKTKELIEKENNKNNRREIDFQNKIDAYNTDAKSLICVNTFLSNYKYNMKFIDDRNEKKCEFLKEVYSDFLRK
ncbi:MAG: DUF262 domain-containing protein [Acetobacter sp.]|nr:DUF262 domain-containing protein [Bacteroides sp.]MCM1341691.1 DUF262 domain-containing protein [Acetobacter sp.]MCM1432371.1 DUF262 domain-containing protein [Clostridiales bacterium]